MPREEEEEWGEEEKWGEMGDDRPLPVTGGEGGGVGRNVTGAGGRTYALTRLPAG